MTLSYKKKDYGTFSAGISIPKSPRATITPSASSIISSALYGNLFTITAFKLNS